MTRQDHRFQMRCSDEFLASLDQLAKSLGTRDRPEVVRIAVRELAERQSTLNVLGAVTPNKGGKKR